MKNTKAINAALAAVTAAASIFGDAMGGLHKALTAAKAAGVSGAAARKAAIAGGGKRITANLCYHLENIWGKDEPGIRDRAARADKGTGTKDSKKKGAPKATTPKVVAPLTKDGLALSFAGFCKSNGVTGEKRIAALVAEVAKMVAALL